MIVLRVFGGPLIYLSIMSMIIGTIVGGSMLLDQSSAMADTQ